MKILASKRDDILKRKAEYEAEYAERKAEYNKQHGEYLSEYRSRSNELIEEIRSELPDTSLDLDITASDSYDSGFEVTVKDEQHMFDDDSPLSWTWKVSLSSDGDVKKESSSWSGLKATTDQHINKLKEILDVLQALNNIDWNEVLRRITPPEYSEYVRVTNPDYAIGKPNFDKQLLEADIEDMIGTDKAILSTNGKYYRGRVYRKIVKATPAQFTVFDIPAMYVDENGYVDKDPNTWNNPYNIRKSTMYDNVVKPVKIVELKVKDGDTDEDY